MAGAYTNLLYHLVFSTKGRQKVLEPSIEDELFSYIGGIVRDLDGSLLQAGAAMDHVHLLALLSPVHGVSEALRQIKGSSSRWINEGRRVTGRFAWQEGYGAFTVSESAKEAVREYVASQREHHRTVSFQDEFRAMLDRHGIEYDENLIWR